MASTPPRLCEIARFTENVPGLVAFYSCLLGRDPTATGDKCASFDLDGVELFIHQKHEPIPGGPTGEDHLAFEVEDPDVEAGKMVRQGYTLVAEPSDYPWGRSAYLRDPDGRLVEFLKSKRPFT